MKIRLLIILLLSVSISFAQTANNQVDAKGKKQGYWKKYDDKGTLLYEGTFKNDVPVGVFNYYHKNGKLKSTTNFIQGVHKVFTTMYHENGKKAAEGIFIDQQKDSIWNYYSENSQLINTESYNKGVKDGIWRTYSVQTGTLLEEENYSNDKLNGTKKSYFTNGNLSTQIEYINGKMNGAAESYYPDKTLSSKGLYHQNSRHGNWDFYDKNGRIRKSVEYNHAKELKHYLYLYVGSNGQKVNQDLVAYFHKTGDKTTVTMKNGKTFTSTDSYETATEFLDFVDFTVVNPSYTAAYSSIIKYRDLDKESIEVILSPATEEPVISQGDQAMGIKMLFKTGLPKDE